MRKILVIVAFVALAAFVLFTIAHILRGGSGLDPEENPFTCALFVANTIENSDTRAKIFAEIAIEYADAGQCDQALRVVQRVEAGKYRSRPLAHIAVAHAKAGQHERAIRVAKTMIPEDVSYREWALSGIAVEYAEAGKYDEAIELSKPLTTPFHQTWALLAVAGKYLETGQKEKASQLLSQILKIAEIMEDAYAKPNLLARVAARYAEMGEYERAIQLTESIDDLLYESWALGEIGVIYAKSGQADKASESLSQPEPQPRKKLEVSEPIAGRL